MGIPGRVLPAVATSDATVTGSAGVEVYSCDCRGFKENNPVHFCLRCLDAWVDGLPAVFSGKRLEREMRRAAGILARRLKEDPAVARLTLNQVLGVAERVH